MYPSMPSEPTQLCYAFKQTERFNPYAAKVSNSTERVVWNNLKYNSSVQKKVAVLAR